MKATEKLHNCGQGLWLDNVPRELLTSATLKRYLDEIWATAFTSNQHADLGIQRIGGSDGTSEGLLAVEEALFGGVPIDITLLFSREQYLAAAAAFLRDITRRIGAVSPRLDAWLLSL